MIKIKGINESEVCLQILLRGIEHRHHVIDIIGREEAAAMKEADAIEAEATNEVEEIEAEAGNEVGDITEVQIGIVIEAVLRKDHHDMTREIVDDLEWKIYLNAQPLE